MSLGSLYSDSEITPTVRHREQRYFNTRGFTFCVVTPSQIQNLGFKLLAGELPNEAWTASDILVSRYFFEIYQHSGASYFCQQTRQSIQIPIYYYDDLITLSLRLSTTLAPHSYFTVRGIIDTQIDEIFTPVREYATGYRLLPSPHSQLLQYANRYFDSNRPSIHKTIFVGELAYSEMPVRYLMRKNGRSDSQLAQFILNSDTFSFATWNAEQIRWFDFSDSANIILEQFAPTLILVGLIAFLVSAFLLATYIIMTIKETKNEIGILRCIGVSKKAIALIYIIQTILVVLLILAGTLIISATGGSFMWQAITLTRFFPIKLFTITIFDALVALAVLALSSSLACFIPLQLLSQKTPAQILSD